MTYNRIIERKEKLTQTASQISPHQRTDQRPCRPERSLCQDELSRCHENRAGIFFAQPRRRCPSSIAIGAIPSFLFTSLVEMLLPLGVLSRSCGLRQEAAAFPVNRNNLGAASRASAKQKSKSVSLLTVHAQPQCQNLGSSAFPRGRCASRALSNETALTLRGRATTRWCQEAHAPDRTVQACKEHRTDNVITTTTMCFVSDHSNAGSSPRVHCIT